MPPGEEGKDGPEGAAVIGLAGQMFLCHATDSGGVENAGGGDEGGLGKIKGPGF